MTQRIINKYKIKAKKALWQNFLINEEIIKRIWSLVDVNWKNIIEVWPGYWALTEFLLKEKPLSLNLVELDNDMIDILNNRINEKDLIVDNVDFHINNIDVLKYYPNTKDYSVIANIPYYITSPILRHFLYEVEYKPENMVILMQKDVWDKILWKWKNKSSVLSLFIEKKCIVSEEVFVWKENFIPAPKVESSVLLFKTHNNYTDIDDAKFLDLIKKWFKEPRKKLSKNFISSWFDKTYIDTIFKTMSISENTRWEDLDIAIWCELVKEFNK